MPSILITGCSSGFGRAAARLFLDRGWDVVATMRKPNAEALPASDRLRLLALDITDPDSVARAVAAAGPIDVLVNNAGFGVPAPIELITMDAARGLFETNVLGALATVQAVLPQFRARGSGVIVNVSSTVTVKTLPVIGVYRASKAALNALTESLALEVAPFGLRAHIVLPGRSPETQFGANAFPHLRGADDAAYAPMMEHFVANVRGPGPVTHPLDVAEAIWRAATDPSAPLRIPAGEDAVAWMAEAA